MADIPSYDVHFVSHTHWDREWYLPAGRFRQRLVDLIDGLLELDDPDMRFLLDGQAILLEDYLDVRPDRRHQLSARLKAGLLEAGPWYVLADELIPSAEALVRNLLAGRGILQSLGANITPVLYCPDSFGHPASLPVLAAGFGLPLIIVWRGLGGQSWPDGDALRWRASDGTAVLVHHLPPSGYEYGANLPADAGEMAERWRRLRVELGARSRLGLLLMLNGADHHAPQHDLSTAFAALRKTAAADRVTRSSLSTWARAFVRRASDQKIPVIEGELRDSYGYTWTLQGTLASRAHLKRKNAKVERMLLRDAEPWSALASRRAGKSRSHLVRAAWRTVLSCHPHDTLCGCVVDSVAEAVECRLADAEVQAAGVSEDAILELVGHDQVAARRATSAWRSVVLVRNRSPHARRGVAEIELITLRRHVAVGPGSATSLSPEQAGRAVFLDAGRTAHQIIGRAFRHDRVESPEDYPHDDLVDSAHVVAWMEDVPAYGIKPLTVGESASSNVEAAIPVVRAAPRALDNGVLRLEVSADGGIRAIQPASGFSVSSLLRFESVGDAGDLYTPSLIGPVALGNCDGTELRHAGPLRGQIDIHWSLTVPESSGRSGRSTTTVPLRVTSRIVLDAGAPFLRIRIAGENTARDHRLRVVLATGITGGDVHADAAFGVVGRNPMSVSDVARWMEEPPPTAPLARYVTISGADRGATVFSDGLAEYEATDTGDVAVTLLRAVGELSRSDLPERPGHAAWPEPTPEAQSMGWFEAELAVLFHGPRNDATIAEIETVADDVLLPLAGQTLRSATQLPVAVSGLLLQGDGLAFVACKESEDGQWIVLRCANLLDRSVEGSWRIGFAVREAHQARLDETIGEPLIVTGSDVGFHAPPRAVVTILAR